MCSNGAKRPSYIFLSPLLDHARLVGRKLFCQGQATFSHALLTEGNLRATVVGTERGIGCDESTLHEPGVPQRHGQPDQGSGT